MTMTHERVENLAKLVGAPRHRLDMRLALRLQDWLMEQGSEGLVRISREAPDLHPLDAIRNAATIAVDAGPEDLTRWNVRYNAEKLRLEIPQGKPGRPTTAAVQATQTVLGTIKNTDDLKTLAVEVARLCRVLELEPVDAAALTRIGGRSATPMV